MVRDFFLIGLDVSPILAVGLNLQEIDTKFEILLKGNYFGKQDIFYPHIFISSDTFLTLLFSNNGLYNDLCPSKSQVIKLKLQV